MYLFEVGLVAAGVVGLVLSLTAYFLLARALWPRLVANAEARFTTSPAISVLTGLPLAVVAFVLITKLLGSSLGVVALPLGALALGFALTGSAGIAARVGRAMPSNRDLGEPVRVEIRGAAVVLLASLTPFIGWFLVLPVLVIGGLGAATLAVLRRSPAPRALPGVWAR